MEEKKFECWAIIELYGHSRIAGKVTETQIGGISFVRVDVPGTDETGFTRFLGGNAIFSITPVTEELAKLAAREIQASPVVVYIPELRKLPAPIRSQSEYDERYNEDGEGKWVWR